MSALAAPNPIDLMFLHAAEQYSHQDASANVGVVLHLRGRAPSIATLRAHVAEHIGRLPCLTHFLDASGPEVRWAEAEPDLDEYVLEHRIEPGDGVVECAVQELRRTPLPRDAAPWRLWLLHGADPAEYAIFYLTSHEVQDAAGICAVVETLFGPQAAARSCGAAVREIDSTAVGALDLIAAATDLVRATRPHSVWSSRARPLSGRRGVYWIDVPTALLHAIGRAAGGSSNDVYLAALAHAVTGWAAEHWPAADAATLPVMVPLNYRSAEEAGLPGNRIALGRVDLPGGRAPAAARLARTIPATASLRGTPRRAALRRILIGVPPALHNLLAQASTTPEQLSVVGSSFPFRRQLHFGQDAVHKLTPLICCPDGFPLTAAVFIYGQTSAVCFQLDKALPEIDQIPGRWRRAVDEMARALDVAADDDGEPDEAVTAASTPLLSMPRAR